MARGKRGAGRPDGEAAGTSGAGTSGKARGSGKPGKPRPESESELDQTPDIRVQLPYFAARIGVFAAALALLILFTNLTAVAAVLAGLVFAGVVTYPLGRMQKKAAARAAASRAALGQPPQTPAA